jgi:hypothetical protein
LNFAVCRSGFAIFTNGFEDAMEYQQKIVFQTNGPVKIAAVAKTFS